LGAAAMLISFGAAAQARDVGFYAGASIGSADLGPDDDTAVKVFGGYQINRTFAAEFGYTVLPRSNPKARSSASGVRTTALISRSGSERNTTSRLSSACAASGSATTSIRKST